MLKDVRQPRRGGHLDRLVRVVGRHSVEQHQSDRRDRRRLHHQEQAGHQHPGLSAQSVRPARHGPASTPPPARCRSSTRSAGRNSRTTGLIHDHCPRRAHFDAGRFAAQFGDAGHRQGWCLYKLGCKGPVTHAPCSTRHFNEVVDCWPIGIGAPCVGCTEKDIAFTVPIFTTADIDASRSAGQLSADLRRAQGRQPDRDRRGRPGRRRARSAPECIASRKLSDSAATTSRRSRR